MGARRLLLCVLMTSLDGWSLSDHARERMLDRAVTASELVRVLEAPARSHGNPEPGKQHQEYWWRDGVCAVVDPLDKVVVTVHVGGGTSTASWERAARARRATGSESDADALLARMRRMEHLDQARAARTPRGRRGAPKAGQFPVTVRYIQPAKPKPEPAPKRVRPADPLKGMAPKLRKLVMLTTGGDLSRVKVIRPGVVEILDVAS